MIEKDSYLLGNKGKPYLIIFDLDGTLIDGSKVHEGGARKAINQVEKEDSFILNKTLEEIIEGQKGLTHEGFAKLAVQNSNYSNGPNQSGLAQKMANTKQTYVQEHAEEVTLYEGVESILPELKKAGIELALFTSSDGKYTGKVFEKYPVLNNINYVLTGDKIVELGKNPKPAPDGIYHILQKLKVPNDKKIVYVGDAQSDYNAVKAAREKEPNITFILFNPGNKDNGIQLEKGDIMIPSFAELLSAYSQLGKLSK